MAPLRWLSGIVISVAILILLLHDHTRSDVGSKFARPYKKLTYSIDFQRNPNDSVTTAENSFNRLVYDTLISFDSDMNLRPRTAEKWWFDKTGKLLTIRIKKSIRFSDGSYLRASDVLASLRYLFEASANRAHFAEVKWVKMLGDYTIQVGLYRPSPILIPMLASGFSVIYKNGSPAIGSGPFVVSGRTGACVRLSKSPWRMPKIKRLDLCKASERKAIHLMVTGQADDMIDIFINQRLDSKDLGPAKILSVNSTYTWLLTLNQKNPIFSSLKNRRCLDWSFNRVEFVRHFVPAQHPTMVMLPSIVGDGSTRQTDKNCKIEGAHEPIGIAVPNEIEHAQQICDFLVDDFRNHGLKSKCSMQPFTKILRLLKSAQDDVALLAIGLEVPSPYYPFTFFSQEGSFNVTGKLNKEIEELLRGAALASTGEQQAERISKLNDIVRSKSLVIPISASGHQTLVNRCVSNLELSPYGPSYVDYDAVEVDPKCVSR